MKSTRYRLLRYSYEEKLSKDDFLDMMAKYKNGDSSVRDRLVISQMYIVFCIVDKLHYVYDDDYEDYISHGAIGLIKAIDTFDISKGCAFSTYAATCIRNQIFMYMRKIEKHMKCETLNTITDECNPDESYLLECINEDISAREDLIKVENNFDHRHVYIKVCELRGRERQIIELMYFSNKTITQEQIAKMLGVHQSTVSRCYKRALTKLRTKLSDLA